MRFKSLALCSASFGALALSAAPAFAQDQPDQGAQETPADSAEAQPGEDEEIVVTGLRRSLESQQNIRRNSDQIVDAIVAEDIGKLPDIAVSETAARIPGIQVTRRGGEADTVLVRGLPDFATTYNGREIFTAETRVVALQDFPSANIAALEVFKTTTAELVEAGLAGLVNVRSRRPFNFQGFEAAGSIWGLYSKQAGEVTPNGNFLISNRWDVGDGEFGALLNVSYTELEYLDSEPSNTDFIAGGPQGSRFPDVQRLFYNAGNRVRPSVNAAVQWRPSPDLEIYAEGLYQGFRNKVQNRLLTVPLWGGAQYTNLVFREGTDLLESGRVVDPFRPDGFQGGTFNQTDTYQFAIGGIYDAGPLRLSVDLARTNSTFTGSTQSVDYRFANRQTVIFDNGLPDGGGNGPQFAFENFDAANPANYLFNGYYEEEQVSDGSDWQARFDATYEPGISFISEIQAGLRYSDREAHREFGSRFLGFDERAPGPVVPISQLPLEYALFRPGFRGTDLQQGIRTFLTPTYASIRENQLALRNFAAARPGDPRSFGTFGPEPVAADPLATYDANEKTLAGYAQVRFEFGDWVDGVIGIRGVRTETTIQGNSRVNQPDPDGGGPLPAPPSVITPVSQGNEYTDWLPNASVRFRVTPEVQLRLSASKTRTRPTFAQLNPSATLSPPPTNCNPDNSDPFRCARTGGGGNPFLNPFTSENYDASIEYYFARAGFVSVSAFRRELQGFIQNQTIRYIDPELGPLELTGPVNTGEGFIGGIEAQFTTFFDFDFVPEWARGFGVQANVTYLDAKTGFPDASGTTAPQQILGVADWTYNLVGMYEGGGLSVRLSYNQRGESLDRRDNRGDDLYLETAVPAGRLDLSTNYAFSENLTVFFDWTNILGDPFRVDLSSARAGAARAEYTRFFRFEETIFSAGIRFRL